MTADILGVTLHGTGPEPVLVLHDWLGDASTYAPMRPYLDGKRYTYAFADLRGYGRSVHLRGACTI
ncbi:alpha/beta fold hydrolase, partial [Azospirillum sp. B4]